MMLKEFIENFVIPNSLIRLWYKLENGSHEQVVIDGVSMEWQFLKNEGIFKDYSNNYVVGVKDILMINNHYSEAINIVIERK